jgi:hypothetical protein
MRAVDGKDDIPPQAQTDHLNRTHIRHSAKPYLKPTSVQPQRRHRDSRTQIDAGSVLTTPTERPNRARGFAKARCLLGEHGDDLVEVPATR